MSNLLGSLLVSGSFQIPEVTIYFNNQVIRGNRSTKESSTKMDAFNSPNYPPLAVYDVNLKIEWHRIQKYSKGKFTVFKNLHSDIAQITLTPFINLEALRQVLKTSSAVIFSCYGMGNMPI